MAELRTKLESTVLNRYYEESIKYKNYGLSEVQKETDVI